LHSLAVHAWGASSSEAALASLVAAVEVDILEVEGVDVAGDVAVVRLARVLKKDGKDGIPKNCQADVDGEISTAS